MLQQEILPHMKQFVEQEQDNVRHVNNQLCLKILQCIKLGAENNLLLFNQFLDQLFQASMFLQLTQYLIIFFLQIEDIFHIKESVILVAIIFVIFMVEEVKDHYQLINKLNVMLHEKLVRQNIIKSYLNKNPNLWLIFFQSVFKFL